MDNIYEAESFVQHYDRLVFYNEHYSFCFSTKLNFNPYSFLLSIKII
jgi:hypothetical protein